MAEQLSSRLNNRVEIWGLSDKTNALNEKDSIESRLAMLWCDIVPRSGKVTEIPSAAAQYETVTHEITFRRSAERYLKPENVIKYRGLRYEIEYVMPHFNMPDRVVAYCRGEVGL